ncbi:MAG: ubiquinol-cytochrome c reductase iron-sulfur subunit [Gammaproteobacteria bacterium]|nr:ubiquinol-cytochrome c reductase iron-sulfur subunit [Gammaproteobacteria bacterium]
MQNKKIDQEKRFWLKATVATGALGGAVAIVPFVKSMSPSERAKAAGSAVEVDISNLKAGDRMVVEWRGKPVWIIRRTQEQLATLSQTTPFLADPDSKRNLEELTPQYARNPHRSIKPEILVAIGICSHLGCSPVDKFETGAKTGMESDWLGGFLCPCHGSTFDIAGRVYKNKPAPDNLAVPPHQFLSENRLLIGEDKKA